MALAMPQHAEPPAAAAALEPTVVHLRGYRKVHQQPCAGLLDVLDKDCMLGGQRFWPGQQRFTALLGAVINSALPAVTPAHEQGSGLQLKTA